MAKEPIPIEELKRWLSPYKSLSNSERPPLPFIRTSIHYKDVEIFLKLKECLDVLKRLDLISINEKELQSIEEFFDDLLQDYPLVKDEYEMWKNNPDDYTAES